METITSDVVEKTWKRMAAMHPAEGRELGIRMSKAQPFVQAYLLAVGERDFNPDEAALLMYLGVVVWQILDQGGRRLPQVSGDALDRAEQANTKMLEYLEGESETDFAKVVESLLSNHNQVEVLRYVVEALMGDPEDGSDIRDENRGPMLVHLKTVVDCFDHS